MKLFDWLRARRAPVGELAPAPASGDHARLVARLQSARDQAALDAEDWAAIDRLLSQGQEHEVIDVLRRWIATQPRDLAATLRLSELLCGRLEHAAARPLLERLLRAPPHRLRALLLLGEGYERAGELDAARRAYEGVIAIDLDHVRARAAADRLRPPGTSARAPASGPPTLDGPAGVTTPVGGRYRLRRELGRGASGTVYLAEDVEIGREVALKILHPRARGTADEARLRAWEEARISASLRHPGVAAIYDLDEERQLIAMELCAGGSLRDRMIAGPLHPREALSAVAQLTAILIAAHERGVVHGDVKPANLLLRRALVAGGSPLADDELVLCDFGIARLSDDNAPAIDQRAVRGTLAYMAPEQRTGQLGPAADLYATGVVALELLAGSNAALLGGDRAALLRGDVRHDGALPPKIIEALGPAAEGTLGLLAALLQHDATARISAAAATALATALVARAPLPGTVI